MALWTCQLTAKSWTQNTAPARHYLTSHCHSFLTIAHMPAATHVHVCVHDINGTLAWPQCPRLLAPTRFLAP